VSAAELQKICTSVFRSQVFIAMKLKTVPKEIKRMSINIYMDGEVEDKFNEMKKMQSKKSANKNGQVHFEEIGRIEPPTIDQSTIQVEVCYVDNPNSFWIQYADTKFQERLALVEHEITAAVDARPDCVRMSADLQEGGIFIAPFEGDHYRARLEKAFPPDRGDDTRYPSQVHLTAAAYTVKVFFIDYGNTEHVRGDLLIPVNSRTRRKYEAIATTPALALECTLAEVNISSQSLHFPTHYSCQ
jgi:hypothetical protein